MIIVKQCVGEVNEKILCHASDSAPCMFFYFLAPDGAPDNVVSSNITSTSLTLTWAPPLIPNGIIRHYIIRAVEVNTGTNFTYQAQSRTTFTVGDLHPYYTYHFNVHAVTIELGPASLNHTVTTLQDGKGD